MSIIGTKIKEARQRKRIRQKDLAEMLEVTETTISTWERGVSEPFPERIPQLEEILGIKLSDDPRSEGPSALEIEMAYWADRQFNLYGYIPRLGSPIPRTTQEPNEWYPF